jgi:hypothetical protein
VLDGQPADGAAEPGQPRAADHREAQVAPRQRATLYRLMEKYGIKR